MTETGNELREELMEIFRDLQSRKSRENTEHIFVSVHLGAHRSERNSRVHVKN
jgi:hypothetical protein